MTRKLPETHHGRWVDSGFLVGLSPYLSALNLKEKSSLMNWIFFLFQTWILQAKQAVKIHFKVDQKSSSSNLNFQTLSFKKQVQIDRGKDLQGTHWQPAARGGFPPIFGSKKTQNMTSRFVHFTTKNCSKSVVQILAWEVKFSNLYIK